MWTHLMTKLQNTQRLAELKEERGIATLMTGDFNISLFVIERISSKNSANWPISYINLINRTHQLTTAGYVFFPSSHRALTKIAHVLGHKIYLTHLK